MKVLKDMYLKHMKEYGLIVKIDTQETRAFFKEYDEKTNPYDYKYIFSDLDSVKQGSIIEALNGKWFCISHAVNINNIYEKSLIREVKFNIKWNNEIIPSIIDARTQDMTSNQYIILPAGNILVTIPENETTKSIKVSDAFFVANGKWQVVGVDYSKIGLVALYAEKTAFADGEVLYWGSDDENPIPIEPEIFIIEIQGADRVEINKTSQYTAIIKNNEDEVVEKQVIWEIAKVGTGSVLSFIDMNGLLKAGDGNETIKVIVKLVDDETIIAEKEVEIYGDWGW